MAVFDPQRIEELLGIQDMLSPTLPDYGLLVLSVTVSDAPLPKITVVLDGPQGIGIDELARVTRRLHNGLEELYGPEANYSLEVTTPGADQPLVDPRQYPRHVGRRLSLKLRDGRELTGPLLAATAEGIELSPETKVKHKTTVAPPAFFPFGDIAEARVVISFK